MRAVPQGALSDRLLRRERATLVSAQPDRLILKDPEPTATQTFVRGFLKEKGDTAATREALLEAGSRQYFRVGSQAVRKADPNHMVLGIRWAGGAPDPVLRANDVFDILSINIYRFWPPEEQIQHIYDVVRAHHDRGVRLRRGECHRFVGRGQGRDRARDRLSILRGTGSRPGAGRGHALLPLKRHL